MCNLFPQEASFKAFLEQPENAPYVEAHQRKEVRKALKSSQRMSSVNFRDKANPATSFIFTLLHNAWRYPWRGTLLLTQHFRGAGVGFRL